MTKQTMQNESFIDKQGQDNDKHNSTDLLTLSIFAKFCQFPYKMK